MNGIIICLGLAYRVAVIYYANYVIWTYQTSDVEYITKPCSYNISVKSSFAHLWLNIYI